MSKNIYKQEDDMGVDTDLQELISEVQQGGEGNPPLEQRDRDPGDSEQRSKIDILDLPPRREVHSHKQGRTHVKFSRPLLRLLLVIIILLGIISGIYFIT